MNGDVLTDREDGPSRIEQILLSQLRLGQKWERELVYSNRLIYDHDYMISHDSRLLWKK